MKVMTAEQIEANIDEWHRRHYLYGFDRMPIEDLREKQKEYWQQRRLWKKEQFRKKWQEKQAYKHPDPYKHSQNPEPTPISSLIQDIS